MTYDKDGGEAEYPSQGGPSRSRGPIVQLCVVLPVSAIEEAVVLLDSVGLLRVGRLAICVENTVALFVAEVLV